MTALDFDGSSVDVTPDGNGYLVRLGEQSHQAEVLAAEEGRIDLLVDGKRLVAYVTPDGQKRWITVNGRTHLLIRSSGGRHVGTAHQASPELAAPMPGQVRAVNVNAGDVVSKGQVLVVLEAMKMEIRLQAPADGKILAVEAKVGETVDRDQILVRLQYG